MFLSFFNQENKQLLQSLSDNVNHKDCSIMHKNAVSFFKYFTKL